MPRGIEGSRSHHWLPRPRRVPVFHRAGFLASTLCLMHLCSTMALQRDAERIIQSQYLLQVSLRTSENPLQAKFVELTFYEVG
jgi:hypothetical protein